MRWQNLRHHFNTHNLTRAFHKLDGSKAGGVDRVTKGGKMIDITSEQGPGRKHSLKSRMPELGTYGSGRDLGA